MIEVGEKCWQSEHFITNATTSPICFQLERVGTDGSVEKAWSASTLVTNNMQGNANATLSGNLATNDPAATIPVWARAPTGRYLLHFNENTGEYKFSRRYTAGDALLHNAGFETVSTNGNGTVLPSDWGTWGYWHANEISVDFADGFPVHTGTKALLLRRLYDDWESYAGVSQDIGVTDYAANGLSLAVSGYFRRQGAISFSTAGVLIAMFDASGETVAIAEGSASELSDTSWTYLSCIAVVPSNAVTAHVSWRLYNITTHGNGGVLVDDVEVKLAGNQTQNFNAWGNFSAFGVRNLDWYASSAKTTNNVSSPTPVYGDLIISQIVEGSDNNKAVELYNGTAAAIDLSGCTLSQYDNGATTATVAIALSGTIPSKKAFVISRPVNHDPVPCTPTITALADFTSYQLTFNGDDVLELRRESTPVDRFGTVSAGASGSYWTAKARNATATRKTSVTNASATFSLDEWDFSGTDDLTGLGTHSFDGDWLANAYVPSGYSCILQTNAFLVTSELEDGVSSAGFWALCDPPDQSVDVIVQTSPSRVAGLDPANTEWRSVATNTVSTGSGWRFFAADISSSSARFVRFLSANGSSPTARLRIDDISLDDYAPIRWYQDFTSWNYPAEGTWTKAGWTLANGSVSPDGGEDGSPCARLADGTSSLTSPFAGSGVGDTAFWARIDPECGEETVVLELLASSDGGETWKDTGFRATVGTTATNLALFPYCEGTSAIRIAYEDETSDVPVLIDSVYVSAALLRPSQDFEDWPVGKIYGNYSHQGWRMTDCIVNATNGVGGSRCARMKDIVSYHATICSPWLPRITGGRYAVRRALGTTIEPDILIQASENGTDWTTIATHTIADTDYTTNAFRIPDGFSECHFIRFYHNRGARSVDFDDIVLDGDFAVPDPTGWHYDVHGGTATATGADVPEGALEIPPELGGMPVTGIGEYAFADCTGLAALTIPDSVTNVGENAFSGCTGLARLYVPAEWEGTDILADAGLPSMLAVVYGNAPEGGEVAPGEVAFSPAAGAWPDAGETLEVALSATPGLAVYYTLDGSRPVWTNAAGKVVWSTSAKEYTGPFTVSNGRDDGPDAISLIMTGQMENDPYDPWYAPAEPPRTIPVVRAAAVNALGRVGDVSSASYLAGEMAARYGETPVFSLCAEWADLFDNTNGPGIYRYPTAEDKTKVSNAHVEFFDGGERRFAKWCDLKVQGGTTIKRPKKSLRLTGRKGYDPVKAKKEAFEYPFFADKPLTEHASIVLRMGGNDWNRAILRDRLAQEIGADESVDGEAGAVCVLFLNGVYWGVHEIRERLDSDWFKARLGIKDAFSLLEYGDNLTYPQVNEGWGEDDEKRTSGAYKDFWAILRQLEAWNDDLSDPGRYAWFTNRVNPDSLAAHFASELFTGNSDWPWNNQRWWRAWPDGEAGGKVDKSFPRNDGRWNWTFHDMDFAFALPFSYVPDWNSGLLSARDSWTGLYSGEGFPDAMRVFLSAMSNPGFRERFLARTYLRLATDWTPDATLPVMERIADGIRGAGMDENGARWRQPPSEADWERQLDVIRGYLRARPEAFAWHTRKRFGLGATRNVVLAADGDGAGSIRVAGRAVDGGLLPLKGNFPCDLPLELEAVPAKGNSFAGWYAAPELLPEKPLARAEDCAANYGGESGEFPAASLGTGWGDWVPEGGTAFTGTSSMPIHGRSENGQSFGLRASGGTAAAMRRELAGGSVLEVGEEMSVDVAFGLSVGNEVAGVAFVTADGADLPVRLVLTNGCYRVDLDGVSHLADNFPHIPGAPIRIALARTGENTGTLRLERGGKVFLADVPLNAGITGIRFWKNPCGAASAEYDFWFDHPCVGAAREVTETESSETAILRPAALRGAGTGIPRRSRDGRDAGESLLSEERAWTLVPSNDIAVVARFVPATGIDAWAAGRDIPDPWLTNAASGRSFAEEYLLETNGVASLHGIEDGVYQLHFVPGENGVGAEIEVTDSLTREDSWHVPGPGELPPLDESGRRFAIDAANASPRLFLRLLLRPVGNAAGGE
jgi:hypothetical protein